MRYSISYNGPSKTILGLLGAGPGKGWVDVGNDTITAKLGWVGSVTVPRRTIVSVERVERVPLWLGFGMHSGFGGTWALNGASSGAVKLTLSEPATGKATGFPVHPRVLYLSLEDPEGFLAAAAPTAT